MIRPTIPQIRMQMTEGLQSSFLQQAVIIDPDEEAYVSLGNVTTSLVVTPDVDLAFSSTST